MTSCRRRGLRCWACRFDVTAGRGRVGRENAMRLYETAVVTIEDWPGPFTRVEVGNSVLEIVMAFGPQLDIWSRRLYLGSVHTYANYAISDMMRHGLVRCVRRAGKRCLQWEVIRNGGL